MEDWILRNISDVLVGIEVLWVAGFLFPLVLYFIIKYRLKKKRAPGQTRVGNEPPTET